MDGPSVRWPLKLQWSRRRVTAETRARVEQVAVVPRASMEPPSGDGGDPLSTGKVTVTCVTLQWSRRRVTAETSRSRVWSLIGAPRFNGAAVG